MQAHEGFDPRTTAIQVATRAPRISVIIPAHNEARNLPHVLPYLPQDVWEVILVDGHSTDGTIEVARRLRPDIRILRQGARGKGDALRCGLAACRGEIVVLMDADGSTDPREIPRFVVALLEGADFAKGSRCLRGGGSADITLVRHLGNRGLNLLVNLLFGTRYSDLCYGFNAFWRDCLECFEVDCAGFEVETLLNLRAHIAHLEIAEVPSYEHTRIHGRSNLHALRDGVRVVRTIWREWRRGADVVTVAPDAAALDKRRRIQALNAAPELAGDGLLSVRRIELGVTTDLRELQEFSTHVSGRSPETAAHAAPRVRDRRDISVILSTYSDERWDDLVASVDSVRRQWLAPREIVVVVDHNPGLLAKARACLEDVSVIDNYLPRGLAARNAGAAAAQGEIVAFLDDDAIAEPDWLAQLSTAFEDPRVLGAGGYIEPLWLAGRPVWFPAEFNWVVGCSYRGLPEMAAPVRNVIGCNMAFRRWAWAAVGGFRTDLGHIGSRPLGCDETEFCIRLGQRWPRHRLLYLPSARVRHRVPAARARFRYFWLRCLLEGQTKARVTRIVGARDGLASERAHVLGALPRGLAHELGGAVAHRDPGGIARAGAIVVGLALTIAGYVAGALRQWRQARSARRHAANSDHTIQPAA